MSCTAPGAVDRESIVRLLCELVDIESPTGKEGPLARFIAGRMREAGFDTVSVDGHANVVGDIRAGRPGKRLVLLTHSDTSPAPAEMRPVKASVAGGAVIGPGAAAPKAAIAAMVEAGRALAARKGDWSGSVAVAIVTKDLRANHDGPREVRKMIEDASLGLTAEPSGNNVVVAARGILHLEVRVSGRAGHWGAPDPEHNALYRVAAFLGALKGLPLISHPQFGLTGFNPFDLRVQASPPHVPESVSLTIDRRLLPGESVDAVVKQVEDLARATVGDEIAVEVLSKMYPFEAKGVAVEAGILESVVRNALGREPARVQVKFGTNAAFLTNELGIPSMVLGPGSLENLGSREAVDIDSVVAAAMIYRDFALRYLACR